MKLKCDLYKISPKKNLKKPKFWTFEVFFVFFKPKKSHWG